MANKKEFTEEGYYNLKIFAHDSILLEMVEEHMDYLDMLIKVTMEGLDYSKELVPEGSYTKSSIKDTIELTKEFLDSVSDNYGNNFEKFLNDGTVNLYYLEDEESVEENGENAYYDPDDKGHENINRPHEGTTFDSFILIHEFIHSQNSSEEDESLDRALLSEGVSRMYELLFYRFMEDNFILRDDANEFLKYYLRRLYHSAAALKEITDVIKRFDSTKIKATEFKEKSKYARRIYHAIETRFKYFIGEELALYTYYNVERGIVTPKNIEDMSKSLNKHGYFTSINYILSKIPNEEELAKALMAVKSEVRSKTMKI